MKLIKFNEGKVSMTSQEFEEIALEALTFVTDDFNDYTYDIWENLYNYFICITFEFKNSKDDMLFDPIASDRQDPLSNYKIYEERSRFWKVVSLTKNQLESVFNQVQFTGIDLFNTKYMLTIKCNKPQ